MLEQSTEILRMVMRWECHRPFDPFAITNNETKPLVCGLSSTFSKLCHSQRVFKFKIYGKSFHSSAQNICWSGWKKQIIWRFTSIDRAFQTTKKPNIFEASWKWICFSHCSWCWLTVGKCLRLFLSRLINNVECKYPITWSTRFKIG